MKRLAILAFILLVACVPATPEPPPTPIAPDASLPDVVAGKWKVKLAPGIHAEALGLSTVAEVGDWAIVESKENPTQRLHIMQYTVIKPVYRVHKMQPEPGWNLHRVRAAGARQISAGIGERLFVVDTGVEEGDEFPGYTKSQRCRSFVEGEDCDVNDPHATHVASIAAGVVHGVSRADVWSAKVLNTHGYGEDWWVAEGLRWAADSGAAVANMSLGGGFPNQLLCESVTYATQRGVIVVAAAGNASDQDTPAWPAACENSIAVTSTNSQNIKSWFANRLEGKDWAFSAPGEFVCAWMGAEVQCWNGTSMASPHVAGVAAMAKALRPELTQAEFVGLLIDTVTDLGEAGWDRWYGWGLLDARAAMETMGEEPLPTITPGPPTRTPRPPTPTQRPTAYPNPQTPEPPPREWEARLPLIARN